MLKAEMHCIRDREKSENESNGKETEVRRSIYKARVEKKLYGLCCIM